MKTTLFDLIWKLKRALEKEGHAPIDLHKFTEDGEYRRTILLNADSSQFQFSAGIRAIYTDLLKDEALDLTKEIDLQQAAADNPDNFLAANAKAVLPAEVTVKPESKGHNRFVSGGVGTASAGCAGVWFSIFSDAGARRNRDCGSGRHLE